MSQKKFDVDKFVAEVESIDDGFGLFDESARFAECPRCGSDTWDELIYGKNGKVVKCNECRGDSEN